MKKITSYLLLSAFYFASYAQHPTNGLVGYYPFNGNTNDESGAGNNGTNYGATLTTDRFGNQDAAYSFDGVSDYIDLGTSDASITNHFTFSAWIKTTMTTNGEIVGYRFDTHPYNWRQLRMWNNGTVLFNLRDASALPQVSISFPVNDDQWHLLTGVYDATGVHLYVDGQLRATASGQAPNIAPTNLRIGSRAGWNDLFYSGSIDEVMIYNRGLTAAEVTAIYNAGTGGGGSGGSLANLEDDGVNVQNSAAGTGHFQWDSLRFDGNTIASTNTDGDISLTPNGNGSVVVDSILELSNNGSARINALSGNLELTGVGASSRVYFGRMPVPLGAQDVGISTTPWRRGYFGSLILGNDPTVSQGTNFISSAGTNENIILSPNGTGAVDVQSSNVINLSDPVNPNDAATKTYVDTQVGNSSVWNSSASDINFTTGNVGIGTSVPDQKLTVKGKIHTEEVIVDLSIPGPDYVFEEDYDLMPLEKIEQFIQSNNHLPEIPSAAEMEENGVELGVMNMLLLKKIEELTLHTIQQQKLIDELYQKIENNDD